MPCSLACKHNCHKVSNTLADDIAKTKGMCLQLVFHGLSMKASTANPPHNEKHIACHLKYRYTIPKLTIVAGGFRYCRERAGGAVPEGRLSEASLSKLEHVQPNGQSVDSPPRPKQAVTSGTQEIQFWCTTTFSGNSFHAYLLLV
eukprot:4312496-Amphidinium_carterae.1